MPIYEYVCSSCGQEFELLQRSMRGVKTARCPTCQQDGAQRKLSVFAAQQGRAKGPELPGSPCDGCCNRDGPCSL